MRRFDSERRAALRYPCVWSYRLIGPDRDALREAIHTVLGERAASVSVSNASRTGRYVSVKVMARVESEEERLAFYEALRAHSSVVVVI